MRALEWLAAISARRAGVLGVALMAALLGGGAAKTPPHALVGPMAAAPMRGRAVGV